MKAKILLIGDYPPPYGGISVHVQQLSEFLAQRRVACRVLDLEPGTDPKKGAVRVTGYFDYFRKLVSFSFQGYTPHVHTNGHNFKSWLAIAGAAWIGFFFGRRGVVTVHSGLAPDYIAGAGLGARTVIRLALWPLAQVIAVNEKIERALLAIHIAPGRVLVLPAFSLGKSSDALPEQAKLWRERFRPLVVSAVYLEKEYGTEFLIDACLALKKNHPQLGCLIIGSGGEKGALQKRIEGAGAEEWIVLLGNVPHEVCLGIIGKGDLFVRPTLFDGDAISVREALALGAPTVASNVGFRPEGTLLFEPGNVADLVRQMERAIRSERRSVAGSEEQEENLAGIHQAYERAFG